MPGTVKVGFYGLSHLGLNSSICLASRGVEVVSVDDDRSLVDSLHREEFPFFEPDLIQLYSESSRNISFSILPSDLSSCDVVYYSRDIPTSSENISDLSRIQKELPLLLPHLKNGCTLVVLSQVTPGFCRKFADQHKNELTTGGINLCYQVETLIFGRAVERALKPERYIIGLPTSDGIVPSKFARVLELGGCASFKMTFESAELAKIAINLFLVSSVSTANMVAALCEKLGASWANIAEVLKLDERIGPHAYLAPGLGIAGGNLERDLEIMKRLSSELGTKSELLQGFNSQLSYAASWPLRQLAELAQKHKFNPGRVTIGVFGLAYKQDTSSIKNSPSIATLGVMKGLKVVAFDPLVKTLPKELNQVHLAETLEECVSASDVLMILTPWKQFKALAEPSLAEIIKNKIVIDPFGVVRMRAQDLGLKDYVSMGESRLSTD